MKKIFYALTIAFLSTTLFAQSENRVLILNEGYFDYFSGEIVTPVSLAAYYPETGEYVTLDEIEEARFASDIEIFENEYYVAADKFLVKYDLLTDAQLASIEIEGIRKVAVNEDYIVVTRGEYLVSLDAYIQVYNRNTLELAFEIPATELEYSTEGVIIYYGTAYVAVNNGFNFGSEVGMIAKVNLETQTLTETIDLGADGINPDNIMFDGETIFTLNNKNYTGSSVSSYKISSGEVSTHNLLNISAGCGTSTYFDGDIFYQEMFGTAVSKYEPLAETFIGEKEFGFNFYALAFDETHDQMYAAETDFFSYGKIHVYDLEGTELTQFDAGVSPGNIIFDIRTSVPVQSMEEFRFEVYPNPSSEYVSINSPEQIQEISITDVHGKLLETVSNISANEYLYSLKQLTPGNYFITVISGASAGTQLITKF